MVHRTHLVAAVPKQVLDTRMKSEKTLRMMSRLESAHL